MHSHNGVAFVRTMMDLDQRADQRKRLDFRPVKVAYGVSGTANGSSIVHLGDTSVICGIKAEIETNPKSHFNFNISKRGQRDPLDFEESTYTNIFAQLKLPELEIDESRRWVLYVDLRIRADAGSIFTAMSVALLIALYDCVLPVALLTETNDIMLPSFAEKVVRIDLASIPIVLEAYGFISKDMQIVIDCTTLEEASADAKCIVAVNSTDLYHFSMIRMVPLSCSVFTMPILLGTVSNLSYKLLSNLLQFLRENEEEDHFNQDLAHGINMMSIESLNIESMEAVDE
ncbi:hypothetical protein PCE1_001597 [Barthelona sp. PCE]